MNKKVIIADPHPIVIDALTSVVNTFDNLNRLNKIVTDGSELNNVLSLYYPDILVIDLDLPNFEGIKSLKSIKRKFRHIKILVYMLIRIST